MHFSRRWRLPVSFGLLQGRDVWTGVVFIGLASAGLWIAQDYPPGTALRLGSGAFPRLVCWGLMAIGVIVLARAVVTGDERVERLAFRAPMFILSAIVLFALIVEHAGLVIGTIVLICVAALGGSEARRIETLVFSGAMALFGVLLFRYGLGLPMKAWP